MPQLDLSHPTTHPIDASTTLVFREPCRGELEVFCVSRDPKLRFMGGVVVFPGGRVDASDGHPTLQHVVTDVDPDCSRFEDPPPARQTFAVAACRECLEEACILPVVGEQASHDDLATLRSKLTSGAQFAALLRSLGWTLDLRRLVPLSRWVTPKGSPRRFDTRFYLMALPAGQRGEHDDGETTTGFWERPSKLVDRFSSGKIDLAPPTLRLLELLSTCHRMDEAFRFARQQCLLPICPEVLYEQLDVYLALPGDRAHSIQTRRIGGTTRFVAKDGRFVSCES